MKVFELFGQVSLKGTQGVNNQLSNMERNAERLKKGMRVMGAAFTAVGVAGLAIIDKTKKINAELGVTAHGLGITTEEMRNLTLATTNVTFPIKEVTATFDLLARAGIKDQEVLADTATAFDTLGDAIGKPASLVTEVMVPAMKTFRLSAEEIAGKTDMMTYMIRNSTVSLEDFNTMVGYTDQEMVDAGFAIDDMAAAMIWMSDNGVAPGRVMLREWNKAVTKSKEENIDMTEALGMTNEELETYKGKLKGATGLTQELADISNEQYTIMDKLKQKWSELTLSASKYLEPMEPILAGMTALGPILMGLSMVNIPRLIGGLASLAKGFIAVGAAAFKAVAGLIVAAAAKIWAWASMIPIAGIALGIAGVAALTVSVLAIKSKLVVAKEGGIFTRPTIALIGEAGPEAVVPLKGTSALTGGGAGFGATITNNFNIAELVIREEADVSKIARELYRLQQIKMRAVGG